MTDRRKQIEDAASLRNDDAQFKGTSERFMFIEGAEWADSTRSCMRDQKSTQFCHEAVDAHARVRQLEKALETVLSQMMNIGVHLSDEAEYLVEAFDNVRETARKALNGEGE